MDLTNTTYQQLSDDSRVWIYQSNRPLTEKETTYVNDQLADFTQRWTSHNRDLKAFGTVFHNRFVVLMVDETQAGASGCSIDSSVHFLQQLQQHLGVDLFDRMTFAWTDQHGQIRTASRDNFARLYRDGQLGDETPVFDHLVKTKKQFREQWIRPLKESWHARMV